MSNTTEFFPVLAVGREDVETATIDEDDNPTIDGDKITDEQLERIADLMGSYLMSDAYWDALRDAYEVVLGGSSE